MIELADSITIEYAISNGQFEKLLKMSDKQNMKEHEN
jgi:hypothetical protein